MAYSGGADSTALLIEEARLRLALAPGGRADAAHPLLVFHVNHGLQDAAKGFEAHCRAFCQALHQQLPTQLHVAQAHVELPQGASVEAQARDARYAALAALAREYGAGTVLLAQHADDQVETVLLALSRGAGVAGLAGMAPEFEHDGVLFARPMLTADASDIRPWLQACEIAFVDDPSNQDERFTRNRLRRVVTPALAQALPAFRTTFARSARLAGEAQRLLDEMASEDFERVGDPPLIKMLHTLSEQRRANVLRHWLKARFQTTGSEAQVQELLNVIQACVTRGQGIHIRVGRGYVERQGDRLRFVPVE